MDPVLGEQVGRKDLCMCHLVHGSARQDIVVRAFETVLQDISVSWGHDALGITSERCPSEKVLTC